MPAANPFAPMIEVGGNAAAGPISARGGLNLSAGDHAAASGYVLFGLLVLVLLWKGKFRFSTTVG